MVYVPIDVVEVRAFGRRVGAVARDERTGFYLLEYAPAWRATGLDLAPTTAPLSRPRHIDPQLAPETFHRLPPLLADALPDDFGNALIDKAMATERVARADITPLDRLAYMGARSMGALEFRPALGPTARRATAIDLGELVQTARSALAGTLRDETDVSDALEHLLQVGTSAGGARAKAVIAWDPRTDEIRSGQAADLPAGFEHWLIKLDGVGRDTALGTSMDYGRIEMAYHLMARDAGIRMTDCRLLHEHGRAHFMTRRYDRVAGDKVHAQTMCALGELDFRQIGAHDHAQLFAILPRVITDPDRAAEARQELFRRMVFNVAAGNLDDHSKNWSCVLPQDGTWDLSPAYDITHAHSPTSRWTAQHLMAVNGKASDITRADLLAVARDHRVAGATAIIRDVLAATATWPDRGREVGVSDETLAHVGADVGAFSQPLRPR